MIDVDQEKLKHLDVNQNHLYAHCYDDKCGDDATCFEPEYIKNDLDAIVNQYCDTGVPYEENKTVSVCEGDNKLADFNKNHQCNWAFICKHENGNYSPYYYEKNGVRPNVDWLILGSGIKEEYSFTNDKMNIININAFIKDSIPVFTFKTESDEEMSN